METARMVVTADANGVLHLGLPVGLAGGVFEIVLVWQPQLPAAAAPPEGYVWPLGPAEPLEDRGLAESDEDLDG